ncbi:MAG: ATP-binding protein [bacterium]
MKDTILICVKIKEEVLTHVVALEKEDYEISVTSDELEAINLITEYSYSLILLASDFSERGELFFIEYIKKCHPQTLVILLLSEHYPITKTIEASRQGAYDFLDKNSSIENFLSVIKRSLDRRKIGQKNTLLFTEIRQKNRQLEWRVKELSALYKIAQTIGSQDTVDDALNTLFTAIKDAIGIDYFLCLSYAGSENFNIYFARGISEAILEKLSEVLTKTNISFLKQNNNIDSISSYTDMLFSFFEKENSLDSLIKGSFVAIPIIIDKELYGIFSVGRNIKDEFSEEEKQFLSIIASQALSLYEKISCLSKSTQLITMGEMISEIAHDLKNPITSIKGALQNLETKWSNENFRKKSLDIVNKGLYRLNELVKELLDFSTPGNFPLNTININDVIENILLLIKSDLVNRDIKLKLDIKQVPLVYRANEKRLKEAFLNIIVNAAEAMVDGGTLEIGTNYINNNSHEYVRITFTDTGIGMSKGIQEKIFDHFFTTKPAGTGLGLSVVNRVVKAHNGFIEVESEKNKGTTFLLYLPVTKETVSNKSERE